MIASTVKLRPTILAFSDTGALFAPCARTESAGANNAIKSSRKQKRPCRRINIAIKLQPLTHKGKASSVRYDTERLTYGNSHKGFSHGAGRFEPWKNKGLVSADRLSSWFV
jgi:hypothetical protein